MQELLPKGLAETVPPLYATEGEADPVVRVHLFSRLMGWDWYLTEYDPETGEAFGYVRGFAGEWGYVSVPELEAANARCGMPVVERDLAFRPAPFSGAVR